jgi:predicted AAA+ superfamily ATPase
MIERHITPRLLAALHDTPVVFLSGARQTGKSTLARYLADGPYPARYLTFDDLAVLAAARNDPVGFVTSLKTPVVLDEVQHVPEIFPAIKAEVDRNRRPGQFLLTGSAFQPGRDNWGS